MPKREKTILEKLGWMGFSLRELFPNKAAFKGDKFKIRRKK
jgi:hypothetical protein|tara:strand:+ start:8840 stop:8962 length:123 start_codon:yes stop_codon:yes gene_type:complete